MSRRAARAVVAVAASASLAALAPTAARATFPGRNGRLVVEQFNSRTLARSEWTVRVDGSHGRLLRHVRDRAVWSPDGRRLLFSGPCRRKVVGCGNGGASGPNELDTVDGRGRHLRRIRFRTPGRWGYGPVEATWSPDARRLLFVRGEPVEAGDMAIFVSATNGRHQRLLLSGAQVGRVLDPQFSPDGRQIAFSVIGHGIYVMNSDGSDVRSLFPCSVQQGCSAVSPAWSPDGQTLAFAGGRPDFPINEMEVQIVDSHGGVPRVVRPGTEPFWSPDGTKLGSILYSGPFSILGLGVPSLQISNADGAGLTTVHRHVDYADWQPLPKGSVR